MIKRPGFVHFGFQPEAYTTMFPLKRRGDAPKNSFHTIMSIDVSFTVYLISILEVPWLNYIYSLHWQFEVETEDMSTICKNLSYV